MVVSILTLSYRSVSTTSTVKSASLLSSSLFNILKNECYINILIGVIEIILCSLHPLDKFCEEKKDVLDLRGKVLSECSEAVGKWIRERIGGSIFGNSIQKNKQAREFQVIHSYMK